MKCYMFFSCFWEKKLNCFCVFTKEIATADSSHLLWKTHCLMQLSFVSRQCLKLRIELSFNQPPVAPTTEESTGDAVVWLCCHFTSKHQGPTQALVTVLCTWALMLLATAGSAACSSTGAGTECQGTFGAKTRHWCLCQPSTSPDKTAIQQGGNCNPSGIHCLCWTSAALGQTVATHTQENMLLFAQWVSLVYTRP